MGVQTIMLVASYFGDKEINLDQNKLIFTILIIQIIAILELISLHMSLD